jgi:hypothetical protein
MGTTRNHIVLTGFLLLLLPAQAAQAGKLDKFEKDATKDRPRHRDRDDYRDHHHYGYGWPWDRHDYHRRDSDDNGIPLDFAISPIGTGLANSMELANGMRLNLDRSLALRELGDPVIPYFRVDTAYQDVSSDIEAKDFYGQLGYGALGVDLRYTEFTEEQPKDTLDLLWVHALARMSYYKHLEIDMGVGMVQMKGNDRTEGFSFTMAALFYPMDWWGVELRPTFAELNDNTLTDLDLSLHLRYSVGGVKFGYRWLKSENLELKGPYAGVVLRF